MSLFDCKLFVTSSDSEKSFTGSVPKEKRGDSRDKNLFALSAHSSHRE